MKHTRTFVIGIVTGAVVAYFFDFRMGSRRRAFLGDWVISLFRKKHKSLDKVPRDAEDRAQKWWDKGLTKLSLRNLIGVGGDPQAFELHKQIWVSAPVGSVFSFWTHYENFPRFMPHVEEVHDLGGGRSRWKIRTANGIPLIWDAEISSYKANEIIAWRTATGSIVGHTGVVRFLPDGDGTRLDVQFGYTLPSGTEGETFLLMLGENPKQELERNLLQVKAQLEKGEAFSSGPAISVRETAEVS